MYIGIITFASGRGWYFAERTDDHSAVFIHQNDVENERYLQVQDRVSFDIAPSRTIPGKTRAANVRYIGHTIARQVGEKAVGRE